jgi:AAA domain/TrwC relaxase
MQIHTHVLIANTTFAGGRWTRLYHPSIYEHAKTASYIYEAHLRDELTRRLGVRWREVVNGLSEIEGFDPDHLRAFSTRREQILEAAGEGATARALQVATLATRETKDRDLTTESLRDLWRARAEEIGLTRESIRATLGHERQAPEGRIAVAEVEAVVTAHTSHFDRRDVIQAVANCLPAGAPGHEVEELADAYLAAPDVIEIATTARGQRFTTRAIWELERKALGTVEVMAAREDAAVVSEIVVSRVLAKRPSMKPDQRAMVERLLGGGEGVIVVVGEAGTGKTYALTAAAEGWSATGAELRVAAPTWRAANVLRSEGLQATSVASLLAEFDRAAARGEAAPGRRAVLVVDEAGMVDSRNLARLIDHAQEADAKLVLIGDPAQLGEIEAGGLFASIAARTEPIVLDEVIRHRHELEREGAKLIREGAGREALSIYQGAERVTVSDDPLARREAMVEDWWRSYERGEDALMIAKRNAEVRELNALAREQMKTAGKLGGEEIEVGGTRFAAGDQIITRINDQRQNIYNRERWRVAEVDAESQRLVLVGIDTRGRVCVDSDYLGRLRERDGGPAIEHAYAATTYQAQGATVDTAFVMADPSMDRQEFYVAASRTREQTYLYATPEIQFDRDEYAPRSRIYEKGSTTLPKPPSATARRSPRTTKPCARSSASFPPTSSPVACMRSTPRLGPRRRTRARTGGLTRGCMRRPRGLSRSRPSARRCPSLAAGSAGRSEASGNCKRGGLLVARRRRAIASRSCARSAPSCPRSTMRPAPRRRSPNTSSPSASGPPLPPPVSLLPATSRPSLASARAIRRKRPPGTRQCGGSRATASKTAWWTETTRLGRSRRIRAPNWSRGLPGSGCSTRNGS